MLWLGRDLIVIGRDVTKIKTLLDGENGLAHFLPIPSAILQFLHVINEAAMNLVIVWILLFFLYKKCSFFPHLVMDATPPWSRFKLEILLNSCELK